MILEQNYTDIPEEQRHRVIFVFTGCGKSRFEGETPPQRLKPFLLLMPYVRAEARTLQKNEFFFPANFLLTSSTSVHLHADFVRHVRKTYLGQG
jgi:hypothetical protein